MANSSRVPVVLLYQLQEDPPFPQAPLTASCWERVSESRTSSAGGTFLLPCHTAAWGFHRPPQRTLPTGCWRRQRWATESWQRRRGEMSVFQRFRKHCLSFFKYFFMYLAAPGLSSGMWNLVAQPGIEPGPPALEVWSLSHWTIKDVPGALFLVNTGCPRPPLSRTDWGWKLSFLVKTHTYNFQINRSNDDICISSASRYGTINPIQCYKHNLVTIAEIHYFSSF